MERRVGGEKGRYRRLRRAHRAPISVLMRLKVGYGPPSFPKEKRPYFFLQRMESHGSGTVTRLVKIRHFLNLIARRDRVKKGGCHCR